MVEYCKDCFCRLLYTNEVDYCTHCQRKRSTKLICPCGSGVFLKELELREDDDT